MITSVQPIASAQGHNHRPDGVRRKGHGPHAARAVPLSPPAAEAVNPGIFPVAGPFPQDDCAR